MTLPGQMTVGEMLGEASAAAAPPLAGVSLVVLGRPQPAGSKRAFTNPKTGKPIVTDMNPRAKPWKQQIAGAARNAMELRGQPLMTGPLEVSVTFVLGRPKGHFGSGRNVGRLKRSAPRFPAVRPDVDKLSRGALDALTGVAWRDDGQVIRKTAEKVYGAPERVEITVRPLDPPTPGVT